MFARPLIIFLGGSALSAPVMAGDLDAPAVPNDPSSSMYTLQSLCDRLDTGATGARRSAPFAEPAMGPGPTMCMLNDIMGKMPALDDTNGATPDDVLTGKTFWGLNSGAWGTQTGAITMQTLSADSTTVNSGYYEATTLNAVDGDLASVNIRSGATIFGLPGNTNVVNTSTGDATASDLLSGKKAWVDGSEITGNIVTQTVSNTTTSQNAGYYNAFNLATVDGDLASGNIRSEATIFGVSGNTNVVNTSTGDAATSDLLSGKKAWVDGSEITGNIATQMVNNTTTSQSAGYYNAFNLATVDGDLVAANIKSGVNLFGVVGTYTGAALSAAFPVPKTGQTTSEATGDDGGLQIGVAWPNPRFTCNPSGDCSTDPFGNLINSDGTVTDNLTGLVWLRNANCWETVGGVDKPQPGNVTWETAMAWVAALKHGSCGLTDGSVAGQWRLPNIKELSSLVNAGASAPALPDDGAPFVFRPSFYWSSTTGLYPHLAWFVSFSDGWVDFAGKTATSHVWPVREGG